MCVKNAKQLFIIRKGELKFWFKDFWKWYTKSRKNLLIKNNL